ncbi:hypothetical protein HEB29_005467 [Streptomyces fulvorobeus]|uniref:Uncharacterized protein n=1 Tax=Streptomyces fulvorobeus TaxID=284028 RepID=A0A7Y9KWN3_9ACTN|nr:hypothetical protein [Streptomyces fulvorobeus]
MSCSASGPPPRPACRSRRGRPRRRPRGNILLQARAHGLVGDLADMRRLVARTQDLRHYTPRGGERDWDRAAALLESR